MTTIDVSGLLSDLAKLEAELDEQMGIAATRAGALIAADAKVRAPVATSALRNSIRGLPAEGRWSAGTLTGGVVAEAPHAAAVEYGAAPHDILPRFRKALRIPALGGFRFAKRVRHPGNRPQPYLAPAAEAAEPAIAREFETRVRIAIRKAGFR